MAGTEVNLLDVLEPVRDAYLVQFFRTMRNEALENRALRLEPALSSQKEGLLRFGALGLPQRADLMCVSATSTQVRQIPVDVTLDFSPVTTTVGGMRVEVTPFAWNNLSIWLDRPLTAFGRTELRRWYLEWYQKRRLLELPQLGGALHALDGPHAAGEGEAYSINLGTAPASALTDLFDRFESAGVLTLRLREMADDDPVIQKSGR